MEELKIGTVVQLKSGGPKMTVKAVDLGGEVFCQWFSGTKLSYGSFLRDTLVVADDRRAGK